MGIVGSCIWIVRIHGFLGSTLKVEAAWSSKMLASNHNTTWYKNLENHKFYLHCHENLKSLIPLLLIVTEFWDWLCDAYSSDNRKIPCVCVCVCVCACARACVRARVHVYVSKRETAIFPFSDTCPGALPASVQWVLDALFPGVKWPGHEADHLTSI